VRVEIDEGIAWVELNRPEKRNAMSPALNAEMVDVLQSLDADDACASSSSRVPATRSRPAWT
jgi:trans-feruloyl-CoA hydratase/vanillin synthase